MKGSLDTSMLVITLAVSIVSIAMVQVVKTSRSRHFKDEEMEYSEDIRLISDDYEDPFPPK